MKKKINISDKTLNLITKNQIKPIPKWEFVVKNLGLWSTFLLSFLVLVIGISLSYFGLIDNIIAPYLWYFIVLIFLVSSFVLFKKTKGAYRFYTYQVLLPIIFLGLVVGGIVFKLGLAGKIDRGLESRSVFYRQMVPMRQVVWSNPKQGYLSGKIISINSNNNFKIEDFDKQIWNITGVNISIRTRVQMIVGEEIKLIGTQISDDSFSATEIRPWQGQGQNMLKENN
ncbi:MAG: hypothetical protein WC069_05180 [Candidatus Shapirobacteria bacterium]